MKGAALLQVTLYGAGPGSLNVVQPGLVRSRIFNTVGCSAHSCQYTTTQPCAQKNSVGGRALEVWFSHSPSEFARLQYPTGMQLGGRDVFSDMSTLSLPSARVRRQCNIARINVRG